MLGQQHEHQVEQDTAEVLWMTDNGVQAGIDQARRLHIAFPLCHATAAAQDEDGRNAEDQRGHPDDPVYPLERLYPWQLVDKESQDVLRYNQDAGEKDCTGKFPFFIICSCY